MPPWLQHFIPFACLPDGFLCGRVLILANSKRSDTGVTHSRILSRVRRPNSLSWPRDPRPACGARSKAASAPTVAPPRNIAIDITIDSLGLVGMKHFTGHDALLVEMSEKVLDRIHTYIPRYVIDLPHRVRYVSVLLPVCSSVC
jgi:hypothetical protein